MREIGKIALVKLDISRNKIEKIDVPNITISKKSVPYFDLFKTLQLIDLSQNKLKEFPMCVCDIPQLKVLRLVYNQITIVPAQVFQYANLQKNLGEFALNSNPIE